MKKLREKKEKLEANGGAKPLNSKEILELNR